MTDMGFHKAMLRLSWPAKPLFQNNKSHWSKKAKATKLAREQGWAYAQLQGVKKIDGDSPRLVVNFHPRKGAGRRPDLHNMPATCKPYIDGIADAMGCDDKNFRVEYPTEWSAPVADGCVTIEVIGPLKQIDNWKPIGQVAKGLVER